MSQRPAATTAVQATDIASESAMSFAHSQIVTVQFQSAPCRTALSLNLRAPLEVDAHSALVLPARPHIAKSRMQIAPIAKTSEASDSMCTQSIPAWPQASAKFRLLD
jgi:hypothetical protein